jgi:nucleoid-associated protein YgaU
MPRAESLSPRLDALLEAVFQAPGDPVSLYWEIAGHLRDDQLAQAQKKIRKSLRQKGEIGAESAVLVACVLHLTGFPAHRILHFLSLYVPGGIRLSLFELAVGAIFLGEPPIPAALLYDLTQYTYLEKRLLARRSIEISEKLKSSLGPGVLLYLYLLSLRDDLSNENIHLIALIMKSCFPALEVRTRVGGASLEEYGEIARAWKNAEQRSRALDVGAGTGAVKRGGRPFDRDSASFFLDRYFSDDALAEMRAAAPPPSARKSARRPTEVQLPVEPRAGTGPRLDLDGGRRRLASKAGDQHASIDRPPDRDPVSPQITARSTETVAGEASKSIRPRQKTRARSAAPPMKREGPLHANHRPVRRTRQRTVNGKPHASPAPGPRAWKRGTGPSAVFPKVVPTLFAALVVAVLLVSVPAGFRGVGWSASPVIAPPAPAQPAPAQPAPSPPMTTTYVVKPGDSLWKIFTSVRSQEPDRRGWMDFLANTRSANSLNDPDRLQPGRILTITIRP